MLDRNGYAPSLMQDNDREYMECFYCGRTSGKIDRHEIFFGKNRKNSKREGMWCDLCRNCHYEVHSGDGQLNDYLKREGQKTFEQERSKEEFVRIFGKDYLW